ITIKQNGLTSHLPRGIFTCSCGFSYVRSGPDRSPADRLRYDRVRSYGMVWTALLKEMWADQKFTIREMIRRLQCTDRRIVSKAISLGLSHPRCALGEKLKHSSSSDWKKPVNARLLFGPAEQREEKLRLTNLYRERLLFAMRQDPEATRTMLTKRVRVAYN